MDIGLFRKPLPYKIGRVEEMGMMEASVLQKSNWIYIITSHPLLSFSPVQHSFSSPQILERNSGD